MKKENLAMFATIALLFLSAGFMFGRVYSIGERYQKAYVESRMQEVGND